jgi:hypothetical protein
MVARAAAVARVTVVPTAVPMVARTAAPDY